MPKSSQIKMTSMVLTQPLILCLSKVRRTFVHTLDTWGEQGSWRSSSGERPQRRWRRDCDHVRPRRLDGGTDRSNLSSCWGEAGRSPDGVGTSPLLCSASWTGTLTWHLLSGRGRRQRDPSLTLFGNILILYLFPMQNYVMNCTKYIMAVYAQKCTYHIWWLMILPYNHQQKSAPWSYHLNHCFIECVHESVHFSFFVFFPVF